MGDFGGFPFSMHPCLRCGACCAAFRVSFYRGEALDGLEGGVPADLTEPIGPFRLAMRGTNRPEPRCVARTGTIGEAASCAIHPVRPTPCREFEPSYEASAANPRCDAARARFGLPPLTPEDWGRPPRRLAG